MMNLKNDPSIVSAVETLDLDTIFLLICRGRNEYKNDLKNKGKSDLTIVRPPSLDAISVVWKRIEELIDPEKEKVLQVDLINEVLLNGG